MACFLSGDEHRSRRILAGRRPGFLFVAVTGNTGEMVDSQPNRERTGAVTVTAGVAAA
jgi:hypothetical protein